ncbi:SMI1/KNR4 family protein [Cognatiyoonia sp. IB215446]|uniref:SMI1/KNR4 family protein n=1 Tax=Cognatiyoonia sp. IB215446 TaxID=3097355 RepID=UPI002A0CADEB|nr:SMI1/KNR4 family protein [Cognatiyoonia sp. IB215446]MDX8349614.1 SMI1/KNR4 family protein [Cognatiyoonia sp. IB215446]
MTMPVVVGRGYFDNGVPETPPNPTYIAEAARAEEIEAAQVELRLKFPPVYREFLLKYGAMVGQGFEIFGLDRNRNNFFMDVVQQTIFHRDALGSKANLNHIVIADDDMGVSFLMDTTNEERPRFVAFGVGYDDYPDVAADFNDFCIQLSIDKMFSRL